MKAAKKTSIVWKKMRQIKQIKKGQKKKEKKKTVFYLDHSSSTWGNKTYKVKKIKLSTEQNLFRIFKTCLITRVD